MSSRALISVLLLLASEALAAQDWGAFAAQSDRSDDPLLLQALREEDFGTSVVICRGVGKRDDPYAVDIIGYLMEKNAGNETAQVEILLRLLLEGIFDPARGQDRIRAAVAANAEALDSMIARIERWSDPQVRSQLVRLFPRMPTTKVLPALLVVGSDLVARLTAGRGQILPQELALALDHLAAVEATRCGDALDQCATIARLSREKVLVDRSRAVAAELIAR